jgi:hypothetical protein
MNDKFLQNPKRTSFERKVKNNNIYLGKRPRKDMTICIAAICSSNDEEPDSIIFAADRLISSSINFEHGNPKIKYIQNRAIIMEAGDASLSDLVLDKWVYEADTANLDTIQIADVINSKIIDLRKHKIESQILSKYGMDYTSFLENSKSIEQSLLFNIMQRIEDFDVGVEFIVAGIDKDGSPHLFVVSDEEGIRCFDSLGFIAIGSGTGATFFDITKSPHNNKIGANEAIVKVYGAKKSAERVSGVGHQTDLGVIFTKDMDEKGANIELIIFQEDLKQKLDEELTNLLNEEKKIKETLKSKVADIIYKKKEKPKIQQ